LDEEMSKHAGLAQQNGYCPAILHSFAEAGKRHIKAVHVQEKSVINMI
jgi:hypothetical protein